jgi:hypothetical protein
MFERLPESIKHGGEIIESKKRRHDSSPQSFAPRPDLLKDDFMAPRRASTFPESMPDVKRTTLSHSHCPSHNLTSQALVWILLSTHRPHRILASLMQSLVLLLLRPLQVSQVMALHQITPHSRDHRSQRHRWVRTLLILPGSAFRIFRQSCFLQLIPWLIPISQ